MENPKILKSTLLSFSPVELSLVVRCRMLKSYNHNNPGRKNLGLIQLPADCIMLYLV